MWNVTEIQIVWQMTDATPRCGLNLWKKNAEIKLKLLETCKFSIGYSIKFISYLTENLIFWVFVTEEALLVTFSEIIVVYYQNMRKVQTYCECEIQSFFSARSDGVYSSLVSNEIKNLAQFFTQTK
jgi:hypothetical protein